MSRRTGNIYSGARWAFASSPKTSGERCPGSDGSIGFNDDRVGIDSAYCPVCGRLIRFHRITGRFARHNGRA